MRKRTAIALIAAPGCAVLAAMSSPWWFGTALAVAGRPAGLRFDSYERQGYTRFVLNGAEVRRGRVVVEARRVELPGPLAWLTGASKESRADGWSVEVLAPSAPSVRPPAAAGWTPLRAILEKVSDGLARWLPPTRLGEGRVVWPGGGLSIRSAEWRGHSLAVAGLAFRGVTADVEVTRTKEGLAVKAASDAARWTAEASATGREVTASGLWHGQPFALNAAFAETGWLPAKGTAVAERWRLPAADLNLQAYYGDVDAGARLDWIAGVLSVDAEASARPPAGGQAPPFTLALHGSGAADRLSVDRAELRLPGIEAKLSEPVRIGAGGVLLTGPSKLAFTADFSELAWFAGNGRATGVVEIVPRPGATPSVTARLSAKDAVVAGWPVKSLEAGVDVDWPVIRVKTAGLRLGGGDELMVEGAWNARTRMLEDGRIGGRVGGETLARWLPAGTDFKTFEIDVRASGVWPDIAHDGVLKAGDFTVGPLKPLAVAASWRGRGRNLDTFAAEARAGESSVALKGALTADSLRIDELTLTRKTETILGLTVPASLVWRPEWSLSGLRLAGRDAGISADVRWADGGSFNVSANGVDPSWWSDFIETRGPAWTLDRLAAQGRWTKDAALDFKADAQGRMELRDGRRARIAFAASGADSAVRVGTLDVTMGERPVLHAAGEVPLSIYPRGRPMLVWHEDAPLNLSVSSEPNAPFWEQAGALAGMTITDPSVEISVTGTASRPSGSAHLRIAKLAGRDGRPMLAWPDIEGLEARLSGDRSGVALESFSLQIDGQTLRASGRLPVKDWAALIRDPLGLAGAEGEARIEIPDADVAALARHAPAYLAPAGRLKIDVALKPGGRLSGLVLLKDAATRPLGPLGVLQSIGAEIELDGRVAHLRKVSATAGGQSVVLSGDIALPKDAPPRLDLALKGERLPFLRQTGLLVRGDLDLKLRTGDDGLTRITGATVLRDSLFLVDIRAMLPTGGARNGPGRRPPYFSVDIPPFAAWPVDVKIDGDRFLRLRTPVFNGLASAHFRLRGTLGDPRASGEVTVDQGQVLLPFASFAVRQGSVRLAEADPFTPQLSLVGTGRSFGYDLRMELTGTAEKPNLTFYSTPSLESEQVLLMVMAGETPRNEITYTAGERAARLGTYLGQSLLWQLGADPAATDRLSIRVGERVSRRGRETYGMEYELDPRWSLVGEYDEFDEYNLGVKWRVYSSKPDAKAKEAGDAP